MGMWMSWLMWGKKAPRLNGRNILFMAWNMWELGPFHNFTCTLFWSNDTYIKIIAIEIRASNDKQHTYTLAHTEWIYQMLCLTATILKLVWEQTGKIIGKHRYILANKLHNGLSKTSAKWERTKQKSLCSLTQAHTEYYWIHIEDKPTSWLNYFAYHPSRIFSCKAKMMIMFQICPF